MKENKVEIEDALAELNSTLREQCVDTQLVTIQQWNEEIAPKLSKLSMAISGVKITARTYELPINYFAD